MVYNFLILFNPKYKANYIQYDNIYKGKIIEKCIKKPFIYEKLPKTFFFVKKYLKNLLCF